MKYLNLSNYTIFLKKKTNYLRLNNDARYPSFLKKNILCWINEY